MTTITYQQAVDAHKALLEIARIDNLPAVPLGMAIRQGVRVLAPICEDVGEEYNKLVEKHVEKDETGVKVVAETKPDGSPKSYKLTSPDAFNADYGALFQAPVEVGWHIPENFFTGVNLRIELLISLGDLLTSSTNGAK